MKRKHIPGGCYCCGCEEIDIDILPNISIPGYTFLNWGGSACCKCAFFAPDDTTWSESCSDVFASVEEVTSAQYQRMGAVAPLPRLANSFDGVPCPTPPEYCCYSGMFAISEHAADQTKRLSYKLFMMHRPYLIQVCFSHQLVTCGEDEPVMKWIVRVRKEFAVQIFATEGRYISVSHVGTILHDCFEPLESQPCSYSCTQEEEAACTFEDLEFGPAGPGDCQLLNVPSIVGFDRVKFFDELPDTQQIFTSDDTPEDCTWEYCENELEYDTQICFSQSSYHQCFPDCLCSQTYTGEIVEDTVLFRHCLCDGCVGIGTGLTFTVFSGENCDFVSSSCCGCESSTPDGFYLCDEFTINRLRIPLAGLIDIDEDCPDVLRDLIYFSGLSCDNLPPFYTTLFNTGTGYTYVEAHGCTSRKFCDIQNCDEDCCVSFVCAGNSQVINCSPKFDDLLLTNWISYDVSITCMLYPQSLCITFGNVTVDFS